MAIYSKLATTDIKTILSQYDLGDIVETKPLFGGQENSSYKIKTDRDTYILSISEDKPFKNVELLTILLEHLEQHQFKTTRVIKTKQSKKLMRYNNKPIYIKRFITGEVILQLNEKQVFQLGECLARLHDIQPCQHLLNRHPYGIESFPEIFDTPDRYGFISWLKEKTNHIKKKIDPTLPRGFIHGDLFYDNTLFQGDLLVAFLDFEESCHYYKIFDIGMAAVGNCIIEGQISESLLKSLIDGYQSQRKLEKKELASMQLFIEYAAVTTAFWRYRQYNIHRPMADKSTSFQTMKLIADQAHKLA